MTRTATGFCVAAALGWAVSLGAQSPTSTTAGQRPMTSDKAHDITITGCLSKSADGDFILTNARESKAGDDYATTTAPGSTTTAGTTGSAVPPATATSTTATEPAGSGTVNAPMTWSLVGGSDLEKHVGHKIAVTGRASSDADRDRTPGSTATTGTPPATTTGESHASERRTSAPRLDVQSVKMIAPSCS
jgi:hypothetical protein